LAGDGPRRLSGCPAVWWLAGYLPAAVWSSDSRCRTQTFSSSSSSAASAGSIAWRDQVPRARTSAAAGAERPAASCGPGRRRGLAFVVTASDTRYHQATTGGARCVPGLASRHRVPESPSVTNVPPPRAASADLRRGLPTPRFAGACSTLTGCVIPRLVDRPHRPGWSRTSNWPVQSHVWVSRTRLARQQPELVASVAATG